MAIVIAVAGAGGLGKAIVDVLKTDPRYTVKILSREHDETKDKEVGSSIIAVDYSDIKSLTQTLETNKVHTVISAVAILDETSHQAQLDLIQAADGAKCTKRFAPSEFGVVFHEKLADTFSLVTFKLQAVEALKKTTLEYTLFHCGFFLDFYGAPNVPSYIRPFPFVVDMAYNIAAIPGSGDVPLVFTHTFDVAKFVVASLGLAQWPERQFMIGQQLTWLEFVDIAGNAKGTKFQIIHDDVKDLEEGRMTELPSHPALFQVIPKPFATRMMSALGYWSATGQCSFKQKDTLNDLFPEIKTMDVKEVLGRNSSSGKVTL